MTSRTIVRVALLVLAAQALLSGVWASVAPRSFYDDFPGLGRHWVAMDGPYNEHLMRDYGALNLALAVVTVLAAVWLTRHLVIAAAVAWIVYSVPHVLYHGFNIEAYETGDQVGILGGLLVGPLLAVLVLVLLPPSDRVPADPAPADPGAADPVAAGPVR
jgi:hypothetical protein